MNDTLYGPSSTRQAAVKAAAMAKAITDRATAAKEATRPVLSAVGIVPTTVHQ